MKKAPLLLLIIGGLIFTAHAELHVGEVNTPFGFDIITAGYYKIDLEGNIVFDVIYGGGDWEINLTTVVDANPIKIPFIRYTEGNFQKTTTTIYPFNAGHHTISANIQVGGNHPERASAAKSTWQYTVKSAEEIDYRNSIGNLQNSIDQRGTDLVGVKNDIATLQAAVAGQNKGLSDQVANLKKQVAKATQNDASQSAQQTDAVLSAINGVSQQVTTVNNNVTTGNKQNQTLGIIGISLGAVGIGAGIGIPCMMKSMSDENSETDVNVLKSFNSDRESINYVSTGSSN